MAANSCFTISVAQTIKLLLVTISIAQKLLVVQAKKKSADSPTESETIITASQNTPNQNTIDGNTPRYNVLFILADDMGWADVSYHGNPQIPTPNIDTLAQDGIILAHNYVQPTCTPSRAALMTGAYPIRYGLQGHPLRAHQPAGLNVTFKLMPEYFRDAGYTTHIIGKWHLGYYQPQYLPTKRGFETHLGFYNGGIDFWHHYHFDLKTGLSAHDLHHNGEQYSEVIGRYATHVYKSHLENVLRKSVRYRRPFFIYLATNNVHCGNPSSRIQSPSEHHKQFSYIKNPYRIKHAGNVKELDDLVGEAVRLLQELGQLNQTVIVFSSDNGGVPAGFSYNTSPNYPLRGIKGSMADGAFRVPGFFWMANLRTRGTVNPQLFHITDWLPTLVRAAGIDKSAVNCKDGVDQWDVLTKGEQSLRTEILLHSNKNKNQYALRRGDFKILADKPNVFYDYDWYKPQGDPNPNPESVIKARQNCLVAQALYCLYGTFVINPNVSLIQHMYHGLDSSVDVKEKTPCDPQTNPCLFDIRNDPYETNNLYDSQPEKFNELFERLKFYSDAERPYVDDTVDMECDPYKDGSGVWKPWRRDNDDT